MGVFTLRRMFALTGILAMLAPLGAIQAGTSPYHWINDGTQSDTLYTNAANWQDDSAVTPVDFTPDATIDISLDSLGASGTTGAYGVLVELSDLSTSASDAVRDISVSEMMNYQISTPSPVSSASHLDISGSVSVQGGSSLTVSHGEDRFLDIIQSGGTTTVGQSGDTASSAFNLLGSIYICSDTPFAVHGPSTFSVDSMGYMECDTFTLHSGASGKIGEVGGWSGIFAADTDIHGNLEILDNSLVELSSGDAFTIHNGGTVTLKDFGAISAETIDIDAGAVLNSYGGTTGKGGTINVEGTFNGGGWVVGDLTMFSGSELSPTQESSLYDRLTINGSYTQQAGSMLSIGISDIPDVHDSLFEQDGSGTISLDGSLNVEFHSSFDLQQNMSFTIIANEGTDSVSGTFADLPEGSVVTNDNGLYLFITYAGDTGNDVVLYSLGDPLSGDANLDGEVDVTDLGILATNYGTMSGAEWGDADFTGDGKVNVNDLGVLATYYGQTVSVTCVPEAGSISLLLCGLVSLMSYRRRK